MGMQPRLGVTLIGKMELTCQLVRENGHNVWPPLRSRLRSWHHIQPTRLGRYCMKGWATKKGRQQAMACLRSWIPEKRASSNGLSPKPARIYRAQLVIAATTDAGLSDANDLRVFLLPQTARPDLKGRGETEWEIDARASAGIPVKSPPWLERTRRHAHQADSARGQTVQLIGKRAVAIATRPLAITTRLIKSLTSSWRE